MFPSNIHVGKLTIDSFYLVAIAAILFLMLLLHGKLADLVTLLIVVTGFGAADTYMNYRIENQLGEEDFGDE